MTSQTAVYQLKITLLDSKPPIWRRVLIPATIRLDELHQVIQIAMGWQNCHLYAFDTGEVQYGAINPNWNSDGMLDAKTMHIDKLLTEPQDKLLYSYDFGDDWSHAVLLEKILEPELNKILPTCVKAVGACPPEDCGGIWGYYQLLEVLADPKHEDYKEMRQWLGLKRGQTLDPDFVDRRAINVALRS